MLRPWQERHRHEASHLPRIPTTFLLCTSFTIASVRHPHPTIGTELRMTKRRRAYHHLPVTSSRLGVTVAHHRRRLTCAVLTLRIRRLEHGDASPAARRVPPDGPDAGNGHRRRGLPSVPHAAIGRLGPEGEGGGCGEGSPFRWWKCIGGRARGGVRECGFSFGGGGGWKSVAAAAARRVAADGGGPAAAGEHHEGVCVERPSGVQRALPKIAGEGERFHWCPPVILFLFSFPNFEFKSTASKLVTQRRYFCRISCYKYIQFLLINVFFPFKITVRFGFILNSTFFNFHDKVFFLKKV